MKTIFSVILLLFFSNYLDAQTILLDSISTNQIPKAKLLYETDKGLVYALPQDNMHCLVPKIQSDMPMARAEVQGYIPNPLFKKGQNPMKIIPLNNSLPTLQKEFNFLKTETIDTFPDKK